MSMPEATPAEPAAAVERAPEKIEQVTPVVKLELSGHDGKALLSGGVSVYRLGMKEAAVERELGPGRGGAVAELTLPEAGLYEFRARCRSR